MRFSGHGLSAMAKNIHNTVSAMQMQSQTVKQRQENRCLYCFCKKHFPEKRIALNYAYDFLCTYGLQKPVLGAGISPEWRGAGNTEMLAMRRLFSTLSRICVRDIRDLHRCLKGHCSVLVSLSSPLSSGVSIRLSFPLASGTSSSLFSRISFNPLLMRYCTSSFLFSRSKLPPEALFYKWNIGENGFADRRVDVAEKLSIRERKFL